MNNIIFKVSTSEPTPPEGSEWERNNLTGTDSKISYPVCKIGSHPDYSHWSQNFTMHKSKFLTGICFIMEKKGTISKPLKVGISSKLQDPTDPSATWLAYGEIQPIIGKKYITCEFDQPIKVKAPPFGQYYLILSTDEPYNTKNNWSIPTQNNIPDVFYSYRKEKKKWESLGDDMFYGKFKQIL